MACFERRAGAIWLRVKAQPGAQKDAILTERAGELVIRLNAPAEGGKANRALIAFLAKTLQIAKSEIVLIRGASARHKVIALPQEAESRLMETIEKLC